MHELVLIFVIKALEARLAASRGWELGSQPGYKKPGGIDFNFVYFYVELRLLTKSLRAGTLVSRGLRGSRDKCCRLHNALAGKDANFVCRFTHSRNTYARKKCNFQCGDSQFARDVCAGAPATHAYKYTIIPVPPGGARIAR